MYEEYLLVKPEYRFKYYVRRIGIDNIDMDYLISNRFDIHINVHEYLKEVHPRIDSHNQIVFLEHVSRNPCISLDEFANIMLQLYPLNELRQVYLARVVTDMMHINKVSEFIRNFKFWMISKTLVKSFYEINSKSKFCDYMKILMDYDIERSSKGRIYKKSLKTILDVTQNAHILFILLDLYNDHHDVSFNTYVFTEIPADKFDETIKTIVNDDRTNWVFEDEKALDDVMFKTIYESLSTPMSIMTPEMIDRYKLIKQREFDEMFENGVMQKINKFLPLPFVEAKDARSVG
jgi:hypothetical protein